MLCSVHYRALPSARLFFGRFFLSCSTHWSIASTLLCFFLTADTFFGYQHRVYPKAIPWREPDPEGHIAIVLESDSPFRAPVETRSVQLAGVVPLITEYGKLAVIERKR